MTTTAATERYAVNYGSKYALAPVGSVKCGCGNVVLPDSDGLLPVHVDYRTIDRSRFTWCEHSRQDRWITASE